MQTIPKKRIPFSVEDLQDIDERICLQSKHSNQSEQLGTVKKAAFPVRQQTARQLVESGMNLLELPAGLVNSTVEDAQFLYSTQMFNDILAKSLSTTQVPDAYDNLNAQLREDDTQAILKDEEFRRAIHSRSTAWNSLGMYRSDFNKTDNDKMARNAYVAMVEKAFLDYIGSVNWDVTDRITGDRIDYAYDFMSEPNPQNSFRDVFVPAIRDLFRYDAGAIVKTFNRRMELIEIRPYLGTEFWIEFDRVPQVISVPANDNAMGIRATDYSRGAGSGVGNEVIMQGWWSRGFTWRYWQRSQTGVYIPFTPSEICYLTLYRQSDDVYGTDYIKFLKYWIQYLIDSTVAAGKTFQNGMIPSLILNHPNIYDINQIQQRLTQLRFENQGPTRTGTVMHLVNGESAQSLAQHLHDMEWVEGQKFVAQLVWGYFGFPSDEFIGGDSNRAVAYVHRNVTKSRLLKPMMKYLEDKINREILPYLKGYKKTWEFRFIQEMELDDKQKVAQTGAIRMSSFISGLGPSFPGLPAQLSQKLANDEALTKDELAEVDELIAEAKESMMMQGMGGDVETDPLGDQEQGRYGQGSEMYQPVNISDYGQGGENTEQRMGNKEEVEYQKSELQYEVGEVFYKAGKKYEIISNNGEFAKARIYVKDIKDVPKGRSYKMGTRGGIYYIGTLAEKQQGEGNKRMPRGAVEAEPKNGNGGGNGASRAPASASLKNINLGSSLSREERIKRMKEEEAKKDKERYPARNPEFEENVSNLKGLSDLMTSSAKGEEYAKYQTDKLPSEFIDQIDNNYEGRESLYALLTPKNFEDSASYVREGKSGDEGLDDEIKSIDAMFNGAKNIPAGLSLWRGVSGEYSESLNKLKEGDEISDKYYSSTSLSPERAFLYAKHNTGTSTPTMIRVLSNGTQKGMYINKPVISGSDEKEHEIVLPRNTSLKIVKKESMKLKDKTCNLITVTPA